MYSRRRYTIPGYLKRAAEARLGLLDRSVVEKVVVEISPDPDSMEVGIGQVEKRETIVVDWTVLCGPVKIDAHDELKPDSPPGARPRIVLRSEYEYHATIEGGENVKRYGGPDEGKSPQAPPEYYDSRKHDHHYFHHIDHFFPLDDKSHEREVVDEEETPHLHEFIREMIGWYHTHRQELEGEVQTEA